MIGCILPDITNPYYSSVFLEAECYALQLGYTLVLCNTLGVSSNNTLYLHTLAERQVDGIIYMGGEQQQSAELETVLKKYAQKLPIVTINWDIEGIDCFQVKSDEKQGFELLLEAIERKGHKDVALIAGKRGVMPTEIKVKAYQEAVDNGIFHYNEDYIIDGDFTLESGVTAMINLLRNPIRPTAVIGINDVIAVGALNACHMEKLTVPTDIAIVGFDDINLAHAVYPSITTVAHNYKELGQKAIDVITDKVSMLRKDKVFVYPMELVERESL
ncbi:MAG TPA: substrate-binding domain-containing protein, partial [Lachnospiraceae bacterium]|nr:substrate-binding domain-containing protein [Lachnospiraceae bacterium]